MAVLAHRDLSIIEAPSTVAEHAQAYLSNQRPGTAVTQGHYLKRFTGWLGDFPLASATPALLRHYERFLGDEGLKATSAASYMRGAVRFLRHLEQLRIITPGTFYDFHVEKAVKLDESPVLSAEQLAALVLACQSPWEILALALLAEGGLRAHEFQFIQYQHVRKRASDGYGVVTVIGKGKKMRRVDMPPEWRELLAEVKAKPLFHDFPMGREAAIFPWLGTRHKVRHFTDRLLLRAQRATPKLFEDERFSPHSFRRTMATMQLESGVSLFAVMRRMGHTRSETTLLYAGLSPDFATHLNLPNLTRDYDAK